MQVWAMILVGVLAGASAGVFGIGGGVVIVPMLVFLFKYPQSVANGTSLVALLLPVGILGVLEYHRAGKISMTNIRFGLLIAVGMFVGAYFGAKLAVHLPDRILSKCFAAFLFLVSVKMFFSK
ncbi:MAG: sulfite exporter TauE/SafE family protein [Myxococcota bacterium]